MIIFGLGFVTKLMHLTAHISESVSSCLSRS